MNVYDNVSLSLSISLSVAVPRVYLYQRIRAEGESRSHQVGAWSTIKEHQSASEGVHKPTPVKPDGEQMNISII